MYPSVIQWILNLIRRVTIFRWFRFRLVGNPQESRSIKEDFCGEDTALHKLVTIEQVASLTA